MSATDSRDPAAEEGVVLAAAYDDPEDPTELTVFPAGDEDLATRWLTADVDTVVSLEAAA